ncbi:MAG: DUF58 domain-containing protein [Granulosicoccus sp.]
MKNLFRRWVQRLFRTRADDTLPHVIRHQRIYIVPDKRGLAFLFALFLMLIASVNYALSLGYALCFLLTGLFAATLLHTYKNLAGVKVASIRADNCFAGQAARFHIRLANTNDRRRHGLQICTRNGKSEQLHIDEQSSTIAQLEHDTSQRGLFDLGRLTLKSDWPLGLWTTWSYVHVSAQYLVYPKPETDVPPLPYTAGDKKGELPTHGSQGDVSGLRDYVPGDSPSLIAWKSAARGLGLQVRTFDPLDGNTHAILGLQQTGHPNTEAQLSRLCAWVLHAEATHIDYALELPDASLASNHGQMHEQSALRALALHGHRP